MGQTRAIGAFAGMSHLARLADRFGFTVFDITDAGTRRFATDTSLHIASGLVADNTTWQQVQRNYKPAQIAMISSDELVRQFGNQ